MRIEFDGPTKINITDEDGIKKEIIASSIEIVGELKKTTRMTKKEATQAKQKRYSIRTKWTQSMMKDFIAGKYDDATGTPNEFSFIMDGICKFREAAFKLTDVTYGVYECQLIRTSMAAGVKPSTFAKAIMAASRNKYWIEKRDISIYSLVNNVARLCAEYRSPSPVNLLKLKIEKLLAIDKTEGQRWVDALNIDKMNDLEIKIEIQKIQARIDSYTQQG